MYWFLRMFYTVMISCYSHAECSWQVCNPTKSIMFYESMSPSRHSMLPYKISFLVGQLPFTYLGVPIFKGRSKVVRFLPIVDKVICKLTAWKASLLSIAGRFQLVESVIHSMLMYYIRIYSWFVSLIHLIKSGAGISFGMLTLKGRNYWLCLEDLL